MILQKIIDSLYLFINNHLFFPFAEKINKSKILFYYNFLMESDWWSREQIEEFQNQKLQNLIHHCYNNVPYYKELLKKNGLLPEDIKTKDDLIKLPILTKQIIRENFDKLISNDAKNRKTKLHSTGGSTGFPLQFQTDLETWSMQWACTLRAWKWYGFNFGEKIFTIGGHSLVNKNKFFSKKKIFDKYLMHNFKFSSNELTEEYMEKLYKNFIKIKPTALRGYPSTLYVFAKFIEEKRLDITPIKLILTTGEVLLYEYRKKIQEIIKAPIYDNYGAGDGGITAHECYMHEGLHIAEEKNILEICDNYGNRLEDGKVGKVIVTDLFNYAFPFIRYEVGDLANIKKEYCSCGRKSKLLGEIYGRCGRLLFSKSGVPISPTMLPVLLYPNLDYNNIDNQKLYNMIDRFQIQQDVNGDLKILLKMKKKEYESYESYKYIIENYKKYFVGSDIKLFFVNEIPRFSSGKEDYVISNFKYNL